MHSSISKLLIVGELEPAVAAALREQRFAVDSVSDTSWLGLARAFRARPHVALLRTAHLKAALVARASRVPAVVEAGPLDAHATIARAARLATRTICGGAALRDALLTLGAPPGRTAVLRSLQGVQALPRDAANDNGPRWILCAAPVDEPDRGVADLMLAFLSVARSRPSARLLLCGSGVGARALAQAEAAGLRGRVAWVPATPAQLPGLFGNVAIVVGPARTPSFADAIPEGMAAGAAVVATAVGPHPAWIKDGRTGFLVPPQSPVALASRLAQLIDDPASARRVGQEARRAAQELSAPRSRAAEMARCFHALTRPLSNMAVPLLQTARKTA